MNKLGGNFSGDGGRDRDFDDDNLDGGDDSDRFGNKFSDSEDEMGTSSRDFREEAQDVVKEIPKFNIPIHRIPKFDDRDQPDINDVFQAEKTGDYGNIRPTQRSEIKIQYFSGKCSEIIKGFLYLGGQTIANNQRIMKEQGITHILNCAGDYCENKFPDKFIYKTYFLKDCKTENIEAIFYDSIKYLSEVKEKGGRVFVHCVKGVSRSVTLCMAWLIFTEQMTYDDSFQFIRDNRGVASPNIGFVVQLMMFYQRLYEPYDKFSMKPKIFAVGSHQLEDPRRIVCRLITEERLYNGKNS